MLRRRKRGVDCVPFSGFRQWDLTSRSQIFHDKEGQPRLPRTLVLHRLWNSPIGAFGADKGLHSRIVSPAGAIQNQHTRKSSPLAKDSKRPRNDQDQEDFEKSRKSPGTCLRFCKNRHRHAFASWRDWDLGAVLSFLPSS